MVAYGTWTRADFKNFIRREVMDTNTKWLNETELNQYLDNWLQDLQQEFEFVWAINTFTVGTVTTGSLIFNTSSFTPGMLRCDAVYYNGFRLAGRLLQDVEVGNPLWRNNPGVTGTNTTDTPRLAFMYPDTQNISIWPVPPAPGSDPSGTSSNVFVFEYPCLLSFATDTSSSLLPMWTQWCAMPYVCAKFFQRPGPVNDPKKAMRYWAMYQKAKLRVAGLWHGYLPERYRKLQPAIGPGAHYEYEILLPPPAWDQGTGIGTATGT